MAEQQVPVEHNGRAIGYRVVSDGSDAPTQTYKRYAFAQFVDSVTDDEFEAFLAAKRANTAAGTKLERFYEKSKARGVVDCNEPKTRQAFAYMVTAGILTQARCDELTGQ